jgi:hypothetical protein
VTSDNGRRPFTTASVDSRCWGTKTDNEAQEYARCRKRCLQRISLDGRRPFNAEFSQSGRNGQELVQELVLRLSERQTASRRLEVQ